MTAGGFGAPLPCPNFPQPLVDVFLVFQPVPVTGLILMCNSQAIRRAAVLPVLSLMPAFSYGQVAGAVAQLPGQLVGRSAESAIRKLHSLKAGERLPVLSVKGKWQNFESETAHPLTIVGGLFNASISQLENSDPKYGTNGTAFAQRFGASFGDIASQNFFGEFVFASAFHEDPRYVRMGPEYRFWPRFTYAVSRAFFIQKDSGTVGFNWSNLLGTGASAALSNAYYPAPSRNSSTFAIHFVSSYMGAGLGNLAPEFWPDIRKKFFSRRH